MSDPAPPTLELLQRWRAGDSAALHALLERDLPWIRDQVHRRLGDALRERAETQDFVQETMVEVLRYAPRFEMSDRDQFRGLMARIVENVLRGRHDWFNAQRRAIARERPLPADSVIHLDPPAATRGTTPSAAVERAEREALLRLALELLAPVERQVLILRQWHQRSFREIGEELGVGEDAARMRFKRTLPQLAEKMRLLRARDVDALLAEPPDPAG